MPAADFHTIFIAAIFIFSPLITPLMPATLHDDIVAEMALIIICYYYYAISILLPLIDTYVYATPYLLFRHRHAALMPAYCYAMPCCRLPRLLTLVIGRFRY